MDPFYYLCIFLETLAGDVHGHKGLRDDDTTKLIEKEYASDSLMMPEPNASGTNYRYTFKNVVSFSDVEAMVQKLENHIMVLQVRVARLVSQSD